MDIRLIPVFASILFAVAIATQCHHDDPSTCSGLDCTSLMEKVGCEHGTCTCVPRGFPCLLLSDCNLHVNQMTHCHDSDIVKHHIHCVDGECSCGKH